jgi:3-phytase
MTTPAASGFHRLVWPGVAILLLLCPGADPAAEPQSPKTPRPVEVEPIARPEAKAQTAVVPHKGDAADDPAIWIHPTAPEESLVLGTDKQGGLFAYEMDGGIHQVISDGSQPNNVDVLYGFPMGSNTVDLALAAVRKKGACGFKIWAIDAGRRELTDVTAGGVIAAFGGAEPYGSCAYRSAVSSHSHFFVNNKRGEVEQYQLADAGRGKVAARKVREFKVKSITEGCVADDDLGVFYLGEENVGIWKFGAEPEGGDHGTLIARVGEHGLKADVEGLTIYCGTQGRGYLIASSQGNNTFKVYDRQPPHRFLLTVDPKGGRIDDVSDTDGICVASCPTSRLFPKGIFIAQDGGKFGGKQNFKLYAWEDIAGSVLAVNIAWSPRRQPAGRPDKAE